LSHIKDILRLRFLVPRAENISVTQLQLSAVLIVHENPTELNPPLIYL